MWNQQFNFLQVIIGYLVYIKNFTKQIIKIFYWMRLLVRYKTVWQVFQVNTTAILAELKEKVWEKHFFLFYDNINFYKHWQDQHIGNKKHLVAYTIGYIYFMYSKHDDFINKNWAQKYLNSNLIDYNAVNTLVVKDIISN